MAKSNLFIATALFVCGAFVSTANATKVFLAETASDGTSTYLVKDTSAELATAEGTILPSTFSSLVDAGFNTSDIPSLRRKTPAANQSGRRWPAPMSGDDLVHKGMHLESDKRLTALMIRILDPVKIKEPFNKAVQLGKAKSNLKGTRGRKPVKNHLGASAVREDADPSISNNASI
ncbi:MAG: hypothetical protein AAF478_01965 [Pseudomonadota bacterium]